jgi:glutamyl-tRNA synthetase
MELAKLLIPENTPDFEDIESKYPKRDLPETAKVVRVAPSPTGSPHFGLVFAAMVDEAIAYQTKGLFFLRIEDTDKKREVDGGIGKIIEAFVNFDVKYSEGPISETEELGKYGPYIQSNRQEVYLSATKLLLDKGFAYPCFCSPEKLDDVHKTQETNKEKTGYYGKYATCRDLSLDDVKKNLELQKPFVIRFKSPTDSVATKYFDAIKGEISLPENNVDYVLVKSEGAGLGLPVYHLAAMVDDYLQGVNLVIRGDEWLPSLPVHLQIIDAFGWKRPDFGHLSPVMKMDGETTKRKLSKRKDPEAAASFYVEQGIPASAVRAYVLNIADSRFEDWRKENPQANLLDFPFEISHMGSAGALFDMTKFLDICKQEIANMKAEDIYDLVLSWATKYKPDFALIFSKDKDYSVKMLNIERQGEKKRKDISQWSQILDLFGYFYDELFVRNFEDIKTENIMDIVEVKRIFDKYLEVLDLSDAKEVWFEKFKSVCSELGYPSMKEYKMEPSKYKGHLGDVAMILRIALTGRTTTPDLYEMMQVMGRDRIYSRLSS